MALNKQIIRMSVEGGLDTKTDDKNVLATNFLELENVRFTKTGAFTKRNGYAAYTNNVLDSGTPISSGSALTSLKDELLRYSSDRLYSYSGAETSWVDRGNTQFVLNSEFTAVSTGYKISRASHAVLNNVACYIYYTTEAIASDSVAYRVYDNTTGAVLASGTVQSGGQRPAVMAIGTKFFLFYTFSGSLQFKTIDYTTPSTLSSATTVAASVSKCDIQSIGSYIYVAYQRVAGGGISVRRIDTSGAVSSATDVTDATTDYTALSICSHGVNIRITYSGVSGSFKSVLLSADLLSLIHTAVTVYVSATDALTSVQDPLDSTKCDIYAYIPTESRMYKFTITTSGTVVNTGVLIYQAAPYSKAQSYSGEVYFAVMRRNVEIDAGYNFANAAQSDPVVPYDIPYRTLFLISGSGIILSRVAHEVSLHVDEDQNAILPPMLINDTKVEFTHIEAASVYVQYTLVPQNIPNIVKKYSFDFSATNNYFDTTLADSLHISGGILRMYDGQNLVEHGFLIAPDVPRLFSETTTGAVLQPGSYQYVVVYKWIDKNGQIHRSQPSYPMTYEPTVDPKRPTISVYSLPFTNKTNVEIELYRTVNNETVFYKVASSIFDATINNPATIYTNIVDTTFDSEIISNEVLYTTGGVLENTAAHGSRNVTAYKNRVFLISADGSKLQYSKKRELNSPVEFSEELQIVLESTGGPAIALGVMDDNLIIFKERSIMIMSGDGPNSLGEQDDFRVPQTITADAGCVDANSVVSSPIGLLFKSAKGIYILSRNLSVQYIGAAVETYNSNTVTSAALLSDTNEIRITLNQDKALIYDYFHQKWATDTNINAIDATVFDNIYTYIREDGSVLYETPNVFSDNGDYISMRLTSSWIQVAGIQGFERFYKMMVLGSYKSAHLLNAKFTYNFNPNWLHTTQVNTNTAFAGDSYQLYQFEFRPKIQKCEAFKFQLYDEELSGVGEGFELSNFAAEVGVKQGLNKRADSKVFGAS